MILLRALLGEVLRERRQELGMTLREVSADARVSLGYISEIERGQKEASSECLGAISGAVDLPLSELMSRLSDAIAEEESQSTAEVESRAVVAELPRETRAAVVSDVAA
jgi:transcriptional regulator with XRE-family HTH domain